MLVLSFLLFFFPRKKEMHINSMLVLHRTVQDCFLAHMYDGIRQQIGTLKYQFKKKKSLENFFSEKSSLAEIMYLIFSLIPFQAH